MIYLLLARFPCNNKICFQSEERQTPNHKRPEWEAHWKKECHFLPFCLLSGYFIKSLQAQILQLSIKFYKSNIKLISTFKVYPPPNKTLQKWGNKRKCLKCIKQKVDHVVLTTMGKNIGMWEQEKNSCTNGNWVGIISFESSFNTSVTVLLWTVYHLKLLLLS